MIGIDVLGGFVFSKSL